MQRYVIVGGSAGGISAAQAIREHDSEGPITVLSDEEHIAYSRPRIADLLRGEVAESGMVYRSPEELAALGITVRHARAERLQSRERRVDLQNGDSLEWDSLLLATGASPIVPPIDGLPDHEFSTFLSWNDAVGLRRRLPSIRQAVIVGGGLIGITVADALLRAGVEVTVIELAPQILGRALDQAAARMLEDTLRKRGACVRTGNAVVAVMGPGGGAPPQAVALDSGEEVPCQGLILAIGVRPRTELAESGGVSVNRGIVVDETMSTNVPGIYACGDVAEARDMVSGEPALIPVWPNACWGGRVAGANMAGRHITYSGCTGMNALHVLGLNILSAGNLSPSAEVGGQVYAWQDAGRLGYRKVAVQDGHVSGFLVLGDIACAGVLYGLMSKRVDIGTLGSDVARPDLGLLDLPGDYRRSLWQRAQMVA